MNNRLTRLEKAIGYDFEDRALLERALLHGSAIGPPEEIRTAERLSWLGDAVLHMIVSDDLFGTYPKATKDQLHKMRKRLTENATLGPLGSALGIEEAAEIGASLKQNLAAIDRHIMVAGLLEGVFGAVYLEGGIVEARRVALRILQREYARLQENAGVNQ